MAKDQEGETSSAEVTTRAELLTKLRGVNGIHVHCCIDCKRVYTDRKKGCANLGVNARCQLCEGVRRPLWETAREPRRCCVDNTEMIVRLTDLLTYRLAGPGPWFICNTCRRAQGFLVTTTWWRANMEQEQEHHD